MANVEALHTREILGSRAFDLEYSPYVLDQELREDILSYLGEYRFQLQKYNYELVFSGNSKDKMAIRDLQRGESMTIKAKRAIAKRKTRGESIQREEAELKGLESLEDQLRFAQSRDMVFWASPPGPKEDGYGDYGFLYVGRSQRVNPKESRLSMTAIRIERPSIGQFNGALSDLTGSNMHFNFAEDFLKSPMLVHKTLYEASIETILEKHFAFKADDTKLLFQRAVRKLYPMVEEFIYLLKHGSKEEKLAAFYSIENYALELKNVIYLENYQKDLRLRDAIKLYHYEPPVVSGSCGSTGTTRSNSLFSNSYETLMNAIFGKGDWFTCPKCNYHADGPVGDTCPYCGLTKEEYAKEGGEVCD